MSTEHTAPSETGIAAPPPSPDRLAALAVRFETMVLRRALIVGGLALLVMVGLFLSNFAVDKAIWYWSLMFPVFGVVCLWHELAGGAARVTPLWRILVRQSLHWMFPIVAVHMLFLQHARGQIPADSVALVVVVLLAVTCFLAGVHFDLSFIWVSIVLVAAAMLGTEVETYLWLVTTLGIVALALAAASMAMLRRRHQGQAPAG